MIMLAEWYFRLHPGKRPIQFPDVGQLRPDVEPVPQEVRVEDLPDFGQLRGPRPMLYCDHCGGEFSANRGDYFLASPDTVMRCSGPDGDPHEPEPLRLVVRRIVIEEWPNR